MSKSQKAAPYSENSLEKVALYREKSLEKIASKTAKTPKALIFQ